MSRTGIKIGRIILLLLTAVLTAVIFWSGVKLYDPLSEEGRLLAEWVVVFVLVAACGWVVCSMLHPYFHETGHLLFGLAAGMRLVTLCIPPFCWERKGNKVHMRVSARPGGGRCVMVAKNGTRLRGKLAALAAGGPVGSLCMLAVFVSVLTTAPKAPFILYAFFGVGAANAFYELGSNLLASDTEEETDGQVLWGLMKNSPAAKVECAVSAVQSRIAGGERPGEDKAEELDNLPVLPEDSSDYALLYSLKFTLALDGKRWDELNAHALRLESAREYLSGAYLMEIDRDLVYYYSAVEFDREKAERYAEELFSYPKTQDVSDFRVRAAYELFVEQNFAVARVYLTRGVETAGNCSLAGMEAMEMDLLAELRERLIEREREGFSGLNDLMEGRTPGARAE